MEITPLEIRQQRFHVKLRGFDPEEVDTFLDMVANELEELIQVGEATRQKVEGLQEKFKALGLEVQRLREALEEAGRSKAQALEAAEQDKARDLRADKQGLQKQNRRLRETESELRDRVLLLQHELDRAREDSTGPIEIEVNKYRATLAMVWDMTPESDRDWFRIEYLEQSP